MPVRVPPLASWRRPKHYRRRRHKDGRFNGEAIEYDHPLITQGRIGPAQNRTDVTTLQCPGLLARDGLEILASEQGLELQPLKLISEIG